MIVQILVQGMRGEQLNLHVYPLFLHGEPTFMAYICFHGQYMSKFLPFRADPQ